MYANCVEEKNMILHIFMYNVISDFSAVTPASEGRVNSISDSESESESCGKVLLCVSVCLGFWSASLTNKAWVVFHI